MSESAGLEDGYRRLLAWYPRSFRQEQEDEMLAVLMASAEPGQRRPRWLERVDLIKSAVTMRLVRALRPAPVSQGWTRALAVFGVIAPVFLVMIAGRDAAAHRQRLPRRGRGPARVAGRAAGPPLAGGTGPRWFRLPLWSRSPP